jgi:hypothetical protein
VTAGYYGWGGWRKAHLLAPPAREEVEEFTQSEAEPLGRDHPNG